MDFRSLKNHDKSWFNFLYIQTRIASDLMTRKKKSNSVPENIN